MRQYIRGLLADYERQFDLYASKVGVLMRQKDLRERGKDIRKMDTGNWQRIGMMMVNSRDPLLGTLELMLDAMEEYKTKVSRTLDVLKYFDEMEDLNIAEGTPMTLYLRQGVPFRVVIEGLKSDQQLQVSMSMAP